MKKLLTVLGAFGVCCAGCWAQASGNIGYGSSGGAARAEQNERSKRVIAKEEMPPTVSSQFVEASVLINVKADEYVAVFGVSVEAPTVAECGQKMDATIGKFAGELKDLGVVRSDYYVDFAAQNKIYAYDVNGEVAKEKLAGFELKKNVAVHYKNEALLDRLVLAASHADIFDLIKVDYVVRNAAAVQDRLTAEAARIVKQKAARYERLLGIRLRGPAQIYADKPSIYYPTEMYDSYTAYESEDVNAGYYRQKYVVQGARKSTTFFFNGLSGKGFDYVVNPVIIEPVVQFTTYLKVRYDVASGGKARPAASPRHK